MSSSAPSIEPPVQSACVLVAAEVSRQLQVRLRPREKPFVRVSGASARLHVPVGPAAAAPAVLEVERDGWVLRGRVGPADTALFAQRPTRFGGVFIAGPHTGLSWEGATNGHITVTVQPSLFARVSARVPCARVGLGAAKFAPRDAAKAEAEAGDAGKPRKRYFQPGTKVSVSSRETGADGVDIEVPMSHEFEVSVQQQRRGRSLIALEIDGGVVHGWVDDSVLSIRGKKPPRGFLGKAFGSVGTVGRLGAVARALAPPGRVCANPLALFVRDSTLVRVGEIRAGTRFTTAMSGAPVVMAESPDGGEVSERLVTPAGFTPVNAPWGFETSAKQSLFVETIRVSACPASPVNLGRPPRASKP